MTRPLLALALAATLGACTAAQLATFQTDEAKVAAAIQTGCSAANAAAAVAAPFAVVPQVAGVLTFISAGCGTAEAVAALTSKALADPTTIAWLEKLRADAERTGDYSKVVAYRKQLRNKGR